MPQSAIRLPQRAATALLCLALLVWLLAGCGQTPPASSDASGAASTGDTSAPSASSQPEEPEERSILAPEGQGIYLPSFDPMAEAVYLVNEDTGLVIYQKNAETQYPTASLVKMMTCIIVAEQMERFGWDYDTTLVDSTDKTWVYNTMMEFRQSTGGEPSTADIRQGEVLSVRELLYAALLPSANEAALLLADFACTGYMQNFMYMMNTRAQSLGCTGTVFDDACGLSDLNLTTARDMALITREFMKHPILVEISGVGRYEMAAHEKHYNPYYIHNTNRLMVQSSPYYKVASAATGTIVAGKTGSLGSEWQNFASMATKNGESYICVVLQSPAAADPVAPKQDPPSSPRPALCEAAALYAWAFTNLSVRPALDITQPVTELRVKYSTDFDTVKLLPSDDVRTVLHNDVDETLMRYSYQLPASVSAPVQEGQVFGSITLSIGQQTFGQAQLLAARSIERNDTLFMLNNVGAFFSSTYFKVLVVLLLVGVGLYALAMVLMHQSRNRKKQAARAAARQAGPAPPKPPPHRASPTAPPPRAGGQKPPPARNKRTKP